VYTVLHPRRQTCPFIKTVEKTEQHKVPADTVRCSESHLWMNEGGTTLEQVLHTSILCVLFSEECQHPGELTELARFAICEYTYHRGVQVATPDAT
jgi:hypothetical protein